MGLDELFEGDEEQGNEHVTSERAQEAKRLEKEADRIRRRQQELDEEGGALPPPSASHVDKKRREYEEHRRIKQHQERERREYFKALKTKEDWERRHPMGQPPPPRPTAQELPRPQPPLFPSRPREPARVPPPLPRSFIRTGPPPPPRSLSTALHWQRGATGSRGPLSQVPPSYPPPRSPSPPRAPPSPSQHPHAQFQRLLREQEEREVEHRRSARRLADHQALRDPILRQFPTAHQRDVARHAISLVMPAMDLSRYEGLSLEGTRTAPSAPPPAIPTAPRRSVYDRLDFSSQGAVEEQDPVQEKDDSPDNVDAQLEDSGVSPVDRSRSRGSSVAADPEAQEILKRAIDKFTRGETLSFTE